MRKSLRTDGRMDAQTDAGRSQYRLPLPIGRANMAKSIEHEKIDHCDLHCFRAKYNIQTSNSLQDIRQNHWPMKYMSQ